MQSRRNFLAGSLAAGAGLAISAPIVARPTPRDRIEAAKRELADALAEAYGPGVEIIVNDNQTAPDHVRAGSIGCMTFIVHA